MIRTAITGADSRAAGELIRILINHPDVELTQFVSADKAGLPLTAVHHGLIGESKDTFDAQLSTDKTDLVICVGELDESFDYAAGPKLIWLPGIGVSVSDKIKDGMVYGQPETNRKPLVRGANAAVVPSPVGSVFMASVLPLIQHIDHPVKIEVKVRASDLALKELGDMAKVEGELLKVIGELYPDVDVCLSIQTQAVGMDRVLKLNVNLPIELTQERVEQEYENVYDDHNFSFVVSDPADSCEVEGTEKCLIHLHSTGSGVNVEGVADMRMRGGAGEAVHLLNLLFGLHERTGLRLKGIAY